MPVPFEVDGGLIAPVVRFAAVAALLSLFGTLMFRVFVLPKAAHAIPEPAANSLGRSLNRLTWCSLAAAAAGLALWLLWQAGEMASASSARQAVAALPDVLSATAFGHVIALQAAALLAVAVALGLGRTWLACVLSGVACALQSGQSHAASMYDGPSFLLASDIVHMLAAGAWLGALLPLLLAVRITPAGGGALACRWFSPLGKVCLVALTATAAFQGWVLVGGIPGLTGTGYGWMALIKLTLLGVLFAYAVRNRYWLAPALRQDGPPAKTMLVRSLAVQTGIGVAVIAAATLLSSMPPAMHEQPVWLFPDRFTLDTINEDPDFFNEVVGALLALAGAGALLAVAALLRRRIRWIAAAAALVIAWFAVPHLDLLFVPAYPTSFYHSPTGFAVAAIVQGASQFPTHCAVCHGAQGHGDGPAAASLPVPPADLTAAHLWMHSDGELFWWLQHGIEAPEGGLAMPGFGAILSADERWDLIDYIRAHNAGVAFHDGGDWPNPLQAPSLEADCDGGRSVTLADLGGGFVRLVIAGAAPAPVTPLPGLTTIVASSDPALHPSPGLCVARDEDIAGAYAIVSGSTPSGMTGAEFLIDGAGWLRAMQHPQQGPGGWNDPQALLANIQALQAHPVAAVAGGMHAHMQM